jgi:hypothetical protein
MNILNIDTYKTIDKNNAYFQFIETCKKKNYGTIDLHTHHIIPMYVFRTTTNFEDLAFLNSPENLIKLSVKDHIRAHELLFEIYENSRDFGAIQLLTGNLEKAEKTWRILGAKASHKAQKKRKKQFWDPDFQIEMARRSINKPDAREVRSAGGKKGGITAKLNIAIKAHERFVFSYEGNEIVCVMNCQTGTEVLRVLQAIQPTTKLSRATALLKGSRKSLYGWSCHKLADGPFHSPQILEKLTQQVLGISQIK